ncbi:PIR Superfamily Protein [Plasmodium ovale curtisi]|uniref:PIR Superfamily Protein n=1 Tax=Plasmodium ovale curtisi TaxID=864141 RepID=A0A1A8X627_PLAOA|nr:PIR Superfamily Protein [Plasmodium ovale curtisi]SBS99672.1 PIR Superfamily Protein [Plasmodium ovale curtisi]
MSPRIQHDEMKRLNSISHYAKLDNNNSWNSDDTECNELQKVFTKYRTIFEFCASLTGNLKNFQKLYSQALFRNDRCTYLNIWIYDRLLKEGFKIHDTDRNRIVSKILTYWEKYKIPDECAPEFDGIEDENFSEMKKLYDFVLDYHMIKYNTEDKDYECSAEYSSYIDEGFDLYEKIKSDCRNSVKKYCKVLDDIKEMNNDQEILRLKCKEKSAHPPGESEQEGRSSHQHHRDASLITSPETEVPSSSTGSSNGLAVTFPIMGILIVLFILYKFTPAGPWIHSRLIKKKLFGNNIKEEETQRFLENIYEYENENNQNNVQNISYHPL